jgi:hypothetical protein
MKELASGWNCLISRNSYRKVLMKNVIYTSITSNYDLLRQPLYHPDDFDFICFSNDIPEKQIGVWKICKIPFTNHSKITLSRYSKLNPHLVLPEYDYSLWMDTNIQVVGLSFLDEVRSLIKSGTSFVSVKHPLRSCIYAEIKTCIIEGKISYIEGSHWNKFLRSEKFPENYGLYENNFILKNHNDPLVKSISEKWWEIFLKGPKRDLLILCYVPWEYDIHSQLFKGNLRSTKGLSYSAHAYVHHSIIFKIRKKYPPYGIKSCYKFSISNNLNHMKIKSR